MRGFIKRERLVTTNEPPNQRRSFVYRSRLANRTKMADIIGAVVRSRQRLSDSMHCYYIFMIIIRHPNRQLILWVRTCFKTMFISKGVL